MKPSEDERFKWYDLFWKYVRSGYYQAFVKELLKSRTAEEVDEINRSIRQVYVDRIKKDFIEFGSVSLSEDGSTVEVQDDSFLRSVEPTFVRLMVGNHGPYVEFSEPANKGHFLRRGLQYNHYVRDGKKLYEQFKEVNYADYKAGMWYVSLYQAMNLRIPNEEEFKGRR